MSKLRKPLPENSVLKGVEETLVYNPMYLSHENVWTQAVVYEEIPLGGFHGRGGSRNVLPRVFGRKPLEDTYRLHPYEMARARRRRCSCYHKLCLTSSITLVVSISVLIMVFLIIFQAVSYPSGPRIPASTSSPTMANYSCTCTCHECEESFTSFELLSQELAKLESQLQMLSDQSQTHESESVQEVEKLFLQAESMSESMEQITSSQARHDNSAQISINMSMGCKTTTDSQEINTLKHYSNSFKYIDEAYVITDITCELEMNGTQTLYGEGVIEVVPGGASRNDSVFQYLSEVKVHCNCYYWSSDPKQPTGAFCRRVITRCPYKGQSSVDAPFWVHNLVL